MRRAIVKHLAAVYFLVTAFAFVPVGTAHGQDDAARKQQEADAARSDAAAAKAQASMPYVMAVNANKLGQAGPALLRMGARVPVPTTAAPTGNTTGAIYAPGPVDYQDIGTNIDCTAKVVEGGFELMISVSDTSVYTNIKDSATPTVGDMPVFRSFKSTNTLVMKDGQMREFTAATDRVSGEVVRIGVTLRVVK